MVKDGGITERRASQLLFKKLPVRVMASLCTLDFENCSLRKLQRKIQDFQDWTSLMPASEGTKAYYDDIMDIETIHNVFAANSIQASPHPVPPPARSPTSSPFSTSIAPIL